jgi:mannose-6-phosphate isomerase-like protein (cupin superfamily)
MPRRLSRREFLEKGAIAATALSSGTLALAAGACGRGPEEQALPTRRADTGSADPAGQEPQWRGAVVQANEGQLLVSGRRRGRMRIKVDSRIAVDATMSMLVSLVDPGANIPVHLHRNEDELIFIHTGSGIVTLGENRIPVSPGAVLYGPRNIWHGVENTGSDVLTWCAVYSPPGFEQYFKEVGTAPNQQSAHTPDELRDIALRYGMVLRDA